MVSDHDRNDLIGLYLRQWKAMRNVLKRRFRSDDLADDAMQETWLRLSQMKGDPAAIRNRDAFLLRVASNVAMDLVRKEKRDTARHVHDDSVLGALADTAPSPETSAIDRDQLGQLALALAGLPTKPRTALLLNRCDGLSHREIAAQLNVSESMVAKYLVQALRHCRDHFRSIG